MAEYELIVDFAKCIGCELCETACAIKHSGEANPEKARVRAVKSVGGVAFSVPVKCMRCENPPCEAICPVGAISTDPKTGATRIDEQKCLGCNACTFVCPFGAIQVDRAVGKAVTCDLCDGDPICARFCSWGALEWVRSDDVAMKLKRSRVERWVGALEPFFHESSAHESGVG